MLNLLIALTLPAISTAAEPVELQYKFRLEEPARYEMAQEIQQTQTMFGQTAESSTVVTQELVSELVKSLDDGSVIIANTLESMALSLEGPGFSVQFDSTKPEDEAMLADPTISSMAAMLGIQVQLHLTPSGSVIDVPNLKDIQRVVDDMEDPNVIAGIQPMLARETIIATNEVNYKLLPTEPVSVGDQWERSFVIPFGVSSMTTDFNLTLKSVKDGIAYINIAGSISMPPLLDGDVITTIQDAVVTGVLEFNIKAGLPERYIMTNDLTMEARNQDDEDPMVTVDMVQEVTMTRLRLDH